MKTELQKFESPTPSTLLEKAIEKKVDMAQLKELMDLQERWEKNEAKKKFLEALSLFQSKVPVIKKNKTAKINSPKGSFSYKYGDLANITRTIQKSLTECGLSYRWDFKEKNGMLEVTCHVSHSAGHTEVTTMEAGKDNSGAKNDIQQKGSAQTYLQRYTLIGALGLSTADEDNDGHTSQPNKESNDLTEEELHQQWVDLTSQASSLVELSHLFNKNRKAIEEMPKVHALFTARKEVLKQNAKPAPAMP